jgi:hypothetical protein
MTFGYQIYFSERYKNRVNCWNPDAGTARVVAGDGSTGTGADQKLLSPYGLAIDTSGHLLIADKLGHRIVKLTNRIERIASRDIEKKRMHHCTPLIDNPRSPTGIMAQRNGTLLVAFCDDLTLYRIHANGNLELIAGLPPSKVSVFSGFRKNIPAEECHKVPIYKPTSITQSENGTYYFIERGYGAIRSYHPNRGMNTLFDPRLAKTFRLLSSVPAITSCDEYWPCHPTSLIIGPDNLLYLSDARHRSIWQIDPDSRSMKQIFVTSGLNGRPFGGPAALAFGPDGTLWILDYGIGRVIGIRPDNPSWRLVQSNCSTIYESISCVANEGAGLACG